MYGGGLMPGRCAGFLVLAWQVLCQEPKIGQPNFFGHVPLKPNLDLLNIMLKKFMHGQKVLHNTHTIKNPNSERWL